MMHADRRRGHTVDTRARARSDQQKGITPCSTLKANLPDSGLATLTQPTRRMPVEGRGSRASP